MSDQSREKTVDELAQRFEIQNLLEQYGWTVDHGQWDDWIALFAEDGVFQVWGKDYTGRAAILPLVERTYANLKFMRRHLMLPSITFSDPDHAKIRVYFQLVGATKSGHQVVGAGAYKIDLVRSSRWLIQRCEAHFDYFTQLEQDWTRLGQREVGRSEKAGDAGSASSINPGSSLSSRGA